jgi:cytoskeletal protein CcmA (bactofilin family)
MRDQSMREERGQISGSITVAEPFTLWGSVSGDVNVIDGGKVYIRGSVYGNLIVERGGRVHVFGTVAGSLLVQRKAKVIYSGTLLGDATNDGGRLYIDATATVHGRIRTNDGETRVHNRPDLTMHLRDGQPYRRREQ